MGELYRELYNMAVFAVAELLFDVATPLHIKLVEAALDKVDLPEQFKHRIEFSPGSDRIKKQYAELRDAVENHCGVSADQILEAYRQGQGVDEVGPPKKHGRMNGNESYG